MGYESHLLATHKVGPGPDRVAPESNALRIRATLASSKAGRWISAAAHSIALTAVAIAGGYSFRFLLLVHFWIGAAFGLVIYAIAFAATWLPDC
jgi:hypothetical protein